MLWYPRALGAVAMERRPVKSTIQNRGGFLKHFLVAETDTINRCAVRKSVVKVWLMIEPLSIHILLQEAEIPRVAPPQCISIIYIISSTNLIKHSVSVFCSRSSVSVFTCIPNLCPSPAPLMSTRCFTIFMCRVFLPEQLASLRHEIHLRMNISAYI